MDRRTAIAALASALPALTWAQKHVPKQSDRPQPLTGEEPGFRSMFDGKSLTGWEGDPKYWRVADGCMVGEITPETVIKSNTFIVWKGGSPGDFELKVTYRITGAGNSGINFRSTVVPDKVTPANNFAMRGYQCDIDGQNRYTGNNYEEKGRLFLGVRGQMSRITGTAVPSVLSTFGDTKELGTKIKVEDWNDVHILARGNTLTHIVNGQLMTVVVDDDAEGRTASGLIGVQVHVGPPMKVEYRNWRIKTL
ncbi:MAG: DUF1080 domain-containing protein [Bryobacteraceae bacterium]|nr:DUF1080 domain-containing protein [Bryobacteraceae bacterium]